MFIDCVLNDKPIPIHGDGQQTRSFTYVSDTVDGIYQSMLRAEANGEIINIGSTEEITILELARTHPPAERQGRASSNIEFIPYESFTGKKYEDVMRRVPDVTLCAQLLGVRAQVGHRRGPASARSRGSAHFTGAMRVARRRRRERICMRIGIIGGGLMGLALAQRLGASGHAVTVFERAQQVGGLATWHDFGRFIWDRFYHVILPSDAPLIRFMQRHRPGRGAALGGDADRLLRRSPLLRPVEQRRSSSGSRRCPCGASSARADDPLLRAHPRLAPSREDRASTIG